MKLALTGLTFMGLVAGLCAVVLVNVWKQQMNPGAAAAASEVEVLLAARDLPAGSVVDANCLEARRVAKKEAPKDHLGSPVQVIGKILRGPMVKDQPFTPTCFADEGSGFHVVSALSDGMRAVSVALADHAGLEGLLYPGSIVDVLVSFKAPDKEGGMSQPMTITLLYAVRVLAVEKHTIVSSEGDSTNSSSSFRSASRRHMVTLAVEPKQAEALQLAQEFGTISLTMRNPLDQSLSKADGVALSELANDTFKRLLQARELAGGASGAPMMGAAPSMAAMLPAMTGAIEPQSAAPQPLADSAGPAASESAPAMPAGPVIPPGFTTTVINGPMDSADMILRVTYRDSSSLDVIDIQGGRRTGEQGWFSQGSLGRMISPRSRPPAGDGYGDSDRRAEAPAPR